MNEIQKIAMHLAATFDEEELFYEFMECVATRGITTRKQLLDLPMNMLRAWGLSREGYDFIKRVEEREKKQKQRYQQRGPQPPPPPPSSSFSTTTTTTNGENGENTTTTHKPMSTLSDEDNNNRAAMFQKVTFNSVFEKPPKKEDVEEQARTFLPPRHNGKPLTTNSTFGQGMMEIAEPITMHQKDVVFGGAPNAFGGNNINISMMGGGLNKAFGGAQAGFGGAPNAFGSAQAGFGGAPNAFGSAPGGFGGFGGNNRTKGNATIALRAIWGEDAYQEEEEDEKNEFYYDEKSEKVIFKKFSDIKTRLMDYNIVTDRDGNVDIASIMPCIPSLENNGYYLEDKEEVRISELIRSHTMEALQSVDHGWCENMDGLAEYNPKMEMHRFLKLIYENAEGYFERTTAMIENGKIDFRNMWQIFKKKEHVLIRDPDMNNELLGGKIDTIQRGGGEHFTQHYIMNVSTWSTNGKSFEQTTHYSSLDHFDGIVDIDSLDVLLLERMPTLKKQLMERGEKWIKFTKGNHYFNYEGNMCRKRFWTLAEEEATGRIMIDEASYAKQDKQLDNGVSNYPQKLRHTRTTESDVVTIKKEQLWMTPSYVRGFSFVNKRWGCFLLKNIRPLNYNKDAFNMLVLDEHKKEIINALVTYGEDIEYSDIVDHKGKGCLFLLHGPPGVGKTLTAEAIAEYLERPIYPVSVGELGTSPIVLEQNLTDIMEMATLWNAVVLIDEADIFLERRSETDIVRNAMVGVFLRVVEYFKGVLFLTSNRVRCLDRAMHSRVTAALKYPTLDTAARRIIWGHFMKIVSQTFKLDMDPKIDMDAIAAIEINGRQIRSVMRLAASLALDESSKTLSEKHIRDCVNISNHFQDFVASTAIAQMMEDESLPEKDSHLQKDVWVKNGKLRSIDDTF